MENGKTGRSRVIAAPASMRQRSATVQGTLSRFSFRQIQDQVFAGDVGKGGPGGLLGAVADVFDAGAVIEPLLVGALPPLG